MASGAVRGTRDDGGQVARALLHDRHQDDDKHRQHDGNHPIPNHGQMLPQDLGDILTTVSSVPDLGALRGPAISEIKHVPVRDRFGLDALRFCREHRPPELDVRNVLGT